MGEFRKTALAAFLVLAVILSGCVEQDGDDIVELEYKDDVITIEDFYVSDRTPYEGAVTVVDFYLKNNGEYPVTRVEVAFDAPGFEIEELVCEGGSSIDNACIFDKDGEYGEIEPFDTRKVTLELGVLRIGLLKPQTYTITYYTEYDYFGFRKMDIPIIDGVTVRKPLSEYSQSTPTYGPIKLSFEPPLRGERIEGDKTIKEYWGVRDDPFKVEMEFKHVGSRSIGEITDPEIEKCDVKLDLRGSLERASIGGVYLPCDFCGGGEPDCTDKERGYLFSNKTLDIPAKLTCNFYSPTFSDPQFEDPETVATIWAEFNYTYRYTKAQSFDIQPLNE